MEDSSRPLQPIKPKAVRRKIVGKRANPKLPTHRHISSLPNHYTDWEMKRYEVRKGRFVIERGFSCPKCHRIIPIYKKRV